MKAGASVLPYRDRFEAGRVLAANLMAYVNRPDVIVLALPRGGVPVGFEVSRALNAPLDVWLVRKIGVPGNEELAMGAIATGGVRVLNLEVIRAFDITNEMIEAVTTREAEELERRERAYRGDRPEVEVAGRTVIFVDDGLATGMTVRAGVIALRRRQPARIVVAVPIAAPSTCDELRPEVDEIVCASTPEPFYAVGLWYVDFSPPSDDEIRELLDRAWKEHAVRS